MRNKEFLQIFRKDIQLALDELIKSKARELKIDKEEAYDHFWIDHFETVNNIECYFKGVASPIGTITPRGVVR